MIAATMVRGANTIVQPTNAREPLSSSLSSSSVQPRRIEIKVKTANNGNAHKQHSAPTSMREWQTEAADKETSLSQGRDEQKEQQLIAALATASAIISHC